MKDRSSAKHRRRLSRRRPGSEHATASGEPGRATAVGTEGATEGATGPSMEPSSGAGTTRWTDSHCHLQYASEDGGVAAVLARAERAGVSRMICVGTDLASSRLAVEMAARQSEVVRPAAEVYATVGMHPHDALAGADGIEALLAELEGQGGGRVVAVGECGLDYHYDNSPRAAQREVFARQVAIANAHDLPIVVHTREALTDTLSILESEGVPARTIFHCFTGGPADAGRCLEIGGYLSFSGIVTFTNADDVREAVKVCPRDRLLIETDSPYLTPVPYRGRTNEPTYVPFVGAAVARSKGLPPEEVAEVTSENATAAFRLVGD